jgi:hypothetical protein
MNKRLIYLVMGIGLIAFSCNKEDENPVTKNKPVRDSLVSGAGYANDVYYSLKNGLIATEPRATWNLAFAVKSQSVSIHINSGSKDSLFVWKGGKIADFNSASSLDISGNLTTSMSDTSWYNFSAFEQTMVTSNVYDAGWGIYNSGTHDVVGDSVFILKLANGTYKKIAIVKRAGATHEYTFKYADLAADAAVEEVTIQTSTYPTKNFIYYSIANKQIVDREPDNSTWDFVFTKYDSKQAGYPLVTGILTNEGVSTAKLSDADSTVNQSTVTFSKGIGNFGFDWKHFNGASYDIANQYYYVKTNDSEVYRIKLLSFDFMTGTTVFEKTLLK